MGSALLHGILEAGLATPASIRAYDVDLQRLQALCEATGIQAARDNADAGRAEVVILAVKPNMVRAALADFGADLRPPQILISIAAGVRTRQLLQWTALPAGRVFRTMPNTPCLVKQGATALAVSPESDAEAAAVVRGLLSSVGLVVDLPEDLLDAVTGLSGSGPAYVFLMIEALVEAGVAVGLPRETALELAGQTALGAATMLRQTGSDPATLRQQVTSPGGTTMAGLQVLEEAGFRGIIADTVAAATRRSRELADQLEETAHE
jgi:pyrroline-5-carboxylate reductase